ncbi:MAG: hypothetical protein JW959_01120 [Pirellulales bacterium]|nr:hypothetical protein [Pirellulales bacterium]
MRIFVMSLAIGLLIVNLSPAGAPCDPKACEEVRVCGSADCCGYCGCHCQCEKHCRVVCEMKAVKKHVWVVECEEFCATLPRRHGRCLDGCGCGDACKADCGCSSGKCDPCAVEEGKCRIPPKCGKMRTRKKLIKKEIECKVPVYKCVVVYCCPRCECRETPPPPKDEKTTRNAPMPPALGAL